MPPFPSASFSPTCECDPCCDVVTLKSGTKIVAVFDVIFCFTVTIFEISLIVHGLKPEERSTPEESRDFLDSFGYVVLNEIGFIVVGFLGSIFGILLYKGAQEASEGVVRKCLVFRYLLLVWDLIFFIRELVGGVQNLQLFLAVIELTFELYTILVVHAYVQQLRGRNMGHLC